MKINTAVTKKPRIDMIPLIDSVFLILIVFIYAFLSMTVHRGLFVNIPNAVSGELNREDFVCITINKDGSLYLNKETVDLTALGNKASALLGKTKEKRIYINADRDVNHGRVVSVLDVLRAAGIERIAFQVEKKSGK